MPPLNRLPESLEVGDCFWWLQRYCKPSGNGKKKEAFFHKWDMSTMFKHVSKILKALPLGVLWDPWFRGWIHLRTCPTEPSAATAFWSHPSSPSRWKRCPFRSSRVAVNWDRDTASTLGLGAARSQELKWFPSRVRGSSDGLPKQSLCHDTPHFTPARIGWFSPEKPIHWRQDRGQNHRIWALRWRPAATTGPRDGCAL